MKILCIPAILLLLCSCINPEDKWGTADYFARITGVRFEPKKVTSCRIEAAPDISVFFVVKIPKEFEGHFDKLDGYPKQLPYE